MPNQFVDMSGHQYGRLSVLERAADWHGRSAWLCLCACGNQKIVPSTHMRQGIVRSCGCLHKEAAVRNGKANRRHGMLRSRTYKSWQSMLYRCRNPNFIGYANYGGAGVTVCEQWLKFENFLADMGARPVGLTLDRINPFGNYEPTNCRLGRLAHTTAQSARQL